MAENKDIKKKKKTLSLKLGTKPMFAPQKNIEVGKTVIVEKKRYKKSSSSESQTPKTHSKEDTFIEDKTSSANEKKYK